MARRKSQAACPARLKPNRAAAVISTLTIVTLAVPKPETTLLLARLEITVPALTAMDRYPTRLTGACRSNLITGQALPMMESGSPRLIKAT